MFVQKEWIERPDSEKHHFWLLFGRVPTCYVSALAGTALVKDILDGMV